MLRLSTLVLLMLVTACDEPETGAVDTGSDEPASNLDVVFHQTPPETSDSAASWFSFTAQDATGYHCALDDEPEFACDEHAFVVPDQPGDHRFSVWAEAANGSTGEETTYTWTVRSILRADHPEMVPRSVQPAPVGDDGWRGIFRINCDFAHSAYDDPIVSPGEAGMAHLHRFYGNLLTDADTTWSTLYETPESSCQGNTVNASAYWVPALLAPRYEPGGGRVLDEAGDLAWQVVPAVVGNDDVAHEVFYYSAGVDDLDSIQTIPSGLRMIAGNAATTLDTPAQDTGIVRWHCQTWESSDGANPRFSSTIPECGMPDRLRMDIFFPNCWDGVNLDSSDHKSHMAYPVNDGGPNGTRCPASHPVPIIRPSYHYAFPVLPQNVDPATGTSRGWRLASDGYAVDATHPGGASLHGDWFNGWEPEVLQAVLDTCIQGGLDCHDGNLGNGFRLSGTQPGSQEEPAIINAGQGEHSGHGM